MFATPPRLSLSPLRSKIHMRLRLSNPSRRYQIQQNQSCCFGFGIWCAGRDSNLRRLMPADLQSALVDRLSTDASMWVQRNLYVAYKLPQLVYFSKCLAWYHIGIYVEIIFCTTQPFATKYLCGRFGALWGCRGAGLSDLSCSTVD